MEDLSLRQGTDIHLSNQVVSAIPLHLGEKTSIPSWPRADAASRSEQHLREKKYDRALRFSSGPLLLRDYKYDGNHRYSFLNVPHYLAGQWARLARALAG